MTKYKLIGFLNLFDIIPDFVYPVFELENRLYLQSGKGDKIDEMVLLKETLYSKIIDIADLDTKNKEEKIVISTESKPIYAFQIMKKNIIFGHAEILLEFFTHYKIDDDRILKEEISDFQKEIRKEQDFDVSLISKRTRYYGIGRWGTSTATVFLVPGNGKVTVNRKSIDQHVRLAVLKKNVCQPLALTGNINKFDVQVKVRGGKQVEQAKAIKAGMAQALLQVDASYLNIFQRAGLLIRKPLTKRQKSSNLKARRSASKLRKE